MVKKLNIVFVDDDESLQQMVRDIEVDGFLSEGQILEVFADAGEAAHFIKNCEDRIDWIFLDLHGVENKEKLKEVAKERGIDISICSAHEKLARRVKQNYNRDGVNTERIDKNKLMGTLLSCIGYGDNVA